MIPILSTQVQRITRYSLSSVTSNAIVSISIASLAFHSSSSMMHRHHHHHHSH